MSMHERTLIPKPQRALYSGDEIALVQDAKARFRFDASPRLGDLASEGAKIILDAVAGAAAATPDPACDYVVSLCVDANDPRFKECAKDAYAVCVTKTGCRLVGADEGGAYYAAVTFRALLRAEGASAYLPLCEIVDWPDYSDRGLFIEDRYGSDFQTLSEWKDALDYFADMKLNQLTVGVYGCWCQQYDRMISEYLYVPFKKYPELKTPRNVKYYSCEQRRWIYKTDVLPVMFEEDYLGELIREGKKRNIKIKPLFNSYGHNTLLPRLLPELSAKDEEGRDTGFGVCISSDRTYEILFDIYDEIVDRYMIPNGADGFELGLDEVWEGIGMDANDPFKFHTPFCRCEKCRARSRGELMLDYIIRITKHLKEKGVKHVYVYYDMLFNDFNVLNEAFKQRLIEEGIYDTLVIDWWNYSSEDKLFFGKEINSLFRSIIKPITGYYHWSFPLEYSSNLRGCARLCRKMGYEGMEAYSSMEYCFDRNYLYLAELAWNAETVEDQEGFLRRYAQLRYPKAAEAALDVLEKMRSLMSDNFMTGQLEPNRMFRLDYYMYTYVNKDKPYPRRFPDEVFETIYAERETYERYFRMVRKTSREALDFFSKQDALNAGFFNRTWLLVAMHYCVQANEYLSLLEIADALESCVMTPDDAVKQLDALIYERERLMRTVEEVRIQSTQLTYLRNMSIYRQILIDQRDALACGRIQKLDLKNASLVESDAFKMLR